MTSIIPLYFLMYIIIIQCKKKKNEKMMNKNILKSSIYGLAIGDALGVPVEFKKREMLDRNPVLDMKGFDSHFQPKGTWSDDTSLTLCLLDGLSYSPYSTNRIAKNFIMWLLTGKFAPRHIVFDVGNTTRTSILKMLFAKDPTTCGATSPQSQGNGSLMRIIPMAFYLLDNDNFEKRKQLIYDISSLTHRHVVCKVACHFYVELAMKLLDENGFIQSYNELRICFADYYKGRIDEKYYQSFHRIFSGEIIETERDNINSNGYVIDTLESALWCVANNNCYRDIALSAVNLGGDTDTIAAVSGALAGIIFPESIPTEWIKMLASKQLIDKTINKFWQNV